MRLIDADALKEQAFGKRGGLIHTSDIDAMPTIEQPQTAHWVQKPNIYGVAYCSRCDYELHTNDTNYCPNCGARMVKRSEG